MLGSEEMNKMMFLVAFYCSTFYIRC